MKKNYYDAPRCQRLYLRRPQRLLESLSLEGNVDDIEEGEVLDSTTEW